MTASPQDAPSGDSLPSRSDAGARARVSGRSEGARGTSGARVHHEGSYDDWTPEVWFTVVHEYQFASGAAGVQSAGGMHRSREDVENHLAYCEGMQKRGRPGTNGRYFIAEVREAAAPPSPDAMFDGLERRAEG